MELLLNREELKYYNQDVFANAAVRTLFDISQQKENKNKFAKLFETVTQLKNQQPHNIVLHNAAAHFLFGLSEYRFKEDAKENYIKTLKTIQEANKNVAQTGAKKIRTGSNVFISSYNNQLFSILINAAKHKHFKVFAVKDEQDKVYSTLIKKLKSHKLTIVEIEWYSLNKAIKNIDLCLMGGDILTDKGVFVKKGSHMIAETCQKNNVPVYVCLHTWKYDHKNSMKSFVEQEETFEYLSKNLVNSYLCELGIFNSEQIIREAKFHNKKLFM